MSKATKKPKACDGWVHMSRAWPCPVFGCEQEVFVKTPAEERLIKAALRWHEKPFNSHVGIAVAMAARAVARERGRKA